MCISWILPQAVLPWSTTIIFYFLILGRPGGNGACLCIHRSLRSEEDARTPASQDEESEDPRIHVCKESWAYLPFSWEHSVIEHLTLEAYQSCARCFVPAHNSRTCSPLPVDVLREAQRGLLAIRTYIEPKVPSMVKLHVVEPCRRCHAVVEL